MNDHLMNFERLPNEIFHELFEYFDAYELYRIFSRLNSRIDLLIKNFRYLQIILYSIEDIDHPINRYFLSKTPTLIINHCKQFFDPIKFIFPSIRCLILCQPARVQWDSIQPIVFPNLQRLYLINSVLVYHTEQICRLLFSNEFTCLHTCSLPFVAYEENNQWTGAPLLQSLQVNFWDIRVYQQILDTCPNLIRLKIEFTGGHNQEKLSISDSDKQHSTLRCLSFRSSTAITCELIDSILFFVPNLQQFSLNATYQRPSNIPINTLASILQDRVPKLTRINIDITLPKNLCHQEKPNTNYLLFKSYQIRSSRLFIIGSL
jgi:hypothetical protein